MKKAEAYLFLVPAIVILVAVTIFPFAYAVYFSLLDYSITRLVTQPQFVGLAQYSQLLRDPQFLNAARVTGLITGSALSLQLIIGLMLALLVNQNIRGLSVFRVLLLIPIAVTPVVTGFTWRFLLDTNFGLLNYFLELIRLGKVNWLGDPKIAPFGIVLSDVWQWTPFVFLIFLAGLHSLDRTIFEAARVDGASSSQAFLYLTLPQMWPIIGVIMLIRSIDLIRYCDKILIMTNGGPVQATESLAFFVYRAGFAFFKTSYASAAGILVLISVIILSQILVKVSSK